MRWALDRLIPTGRRTPAASVRAPTCLLADLILARGLPARGSRSHSRPLGRQYSRSPRQAPPADALLGPPRPLGPAGATGLAEAPRQHALDRHKEKT
jgi:hypothetical protein